MQQRRSTTVTVAFLAALALAIEGCNDESFEHCVDENGQVVDPALCAKKEDGQYVHSGTGAHVYRYWYGGRTSVGEHISGGSYQAPHVGFSGSHGTTTRGGFGSTGSGHVGVGA